MSVHSTSYRQTSGSFLPRRVILASVAVGVLAAMALDTTLVWDGSERAASVSTQSFSTKEFGTARFPEIRNSIETRAVDAPTLAEAIAADKGAAAEKYGVAAGIGAVMPVRFTGTVGEGKSGIFAVAVDGVPDELTVRVQTGPAVNGTDLRDATGTIEFGQFKNQIEYQNAGAAINDAMKSEVLAPIDNANLTGKTVDVTGVFKLINPKSWLVTPVRMSVK
ncbi:DUF2291 family protein [Aurantimonas coralicida]|uniref:DUF2291 family protein n=1 Tax=Aurantimonas coralicida TaxID=182270 RepID=UPI001E3F5B63|nr:DUF2291 domain-containing protein [Aurantimonas coralicida]MCD1645561.1 DUF2291 domain-containing protein [Aurantimonas coralicida]